MRIEEAGEELRRQHQIYKSAHEKFFPRPKIQPTICEYSDSPKISPPPKITHKAEIYGPFLPSLVVMVDVLAMVSRCEGIRARFIRGPSRLRRNASARQIFFYLCRELCQPTPFSGRDKLSWPKIGNYLYRDHTSVLYGYNRVAQGRHDPIFDARIKQYLSALRGEGPPPKIKNEKKPRRGQIKKVCCGAVCFGDAQSQTGRPK